MFSFRKNLTSAILYAACCVIIIAINTALSVDGHNKLNLTLTLAVKYCFLFHIIRLQLDNDITMLNMQLTININYPVHGMVLEGLVEIVT